MSTLKAELRDYYHENRICVKHFACPHAAECRAEADEFTPAREASVGARYLEGELPRLLFVSLDPGSGDENREFLVWDEPVDLSDCHQGQHWYQTHLLASELVGTYGPEVSPEEAALYFGHISAVRCSENRDGNAQARPTLYENCQPYLGSEIQILDPDILVTQGDRAEWAVSESFADERIAESSLNGTDYRRINVGTESSAVWFHTYHPAAYGHYWQQQDEEWPVFKEILRNELGGG